MKRKKDDLLTKNPRPNTKFSGTNFKRSKIIVSIGVNDSENQQLMIKYAQNEFLETFLYPRDGLKFFPLSLITGLSTTAEFLKVVSAAVQAEKTANEYIILYQSNGKALQCHVSVMSITSRFLEKTLETADILQRATTTKWAVITLNSAVIADPPLCKKGKLSEITPSSHANKLSKGILAKIRNVPQKGKSEDEAATIFAEKRHNPSAADDDNDDDEKVEST